MKSLLISFLLILAPSLTFGATSSGVLDIAHRGYAAVNPESTLQAFQYAIDSGADGLELDIRQSEDKVLLVTHEPVIPAIGNQRVENTQSKLAFLRTDIPSLEEVIILAKQYRKPLWIEIKQSHLYPGIAQRLVALLKQCEEPSTTALILGYAFDSETYDVLAKNADGTLIKISVSGLTTPGWVSTDFVDISFR